ncbi:MAG TPA: stage II sporulation protein M [Firmicutes bacterium]|jgi:stage II sporulation protein M|nr:stage II sporulation protein M [Bacillota bacterium]
MYRIKLRQHLEEHFISYFFVLVLFAVGVVFGAVAVKALTFSQKQELLAFLQQFFSSGIVVPSGSAVFIQTLTANMQLAALIWLMGIIVFGLPLVIILVFFQGFVLGFSVGFLVHQMGAKGFLLASCSVLPHNLLLVPAFLVISAMSIYFTFQTLRPATRPRRITFRQRFTQYSGNCLLMGMVIFLASVIETWFSPLLVKLIARLL